MAALVLASAIFIGISDPPTEPEVAYLAQADDKEDVPVYRTPNFDPLQSDETLSSDIFEIPHSEAAISRTTRSRAYRITRSGSGTSPNRRIKTNVEPVSLVSRFEPTTLVIYVENGVVRSRVEPWTVSFSN